MNKDLNNLNQIIPEEQNKPEIESGTASERFVSLDIKEAIEKGTTGDFYYFTEAGDGKYQMHAKLPEYGCAGPGEPIFKIRENSNRIAKGFAQKFIGPNGKVDFRAGLRFVAEFDIRLGISDQSAKTPEDPFASKEKAFENAIDWLAKEFDVPMEERNGFKNFCKAAFDQSKNPVFSFGNFTKIWSNFGTMGLAMEHELNEVVELNGEKRPGIFYDPYNASEKIKEVYEGCMIAIEEIQDLARINPASEMKMVTINECSGSDRSNTRFAEMSRQARREMGDPVEEPSIKHFEIDMLGQDAKIKQELNSARNRLNNRINNPPAKQEDEAEYNRKLAELSEAVVVATEKAEELAQKGELKWESHHAPVLGEFTYNNQKYYITTEAFAAESDQFINHAAMTDGVEIGFFRNKEDFIAFYSKEDPHVLGDEEVQKIVDAKNAQYAKTDAVYRQIENSVANFEGVTLNRDADKITAKHNRIINDEYCFSGWENRYQNHKLNLDQKYEPTMGIDLEGISSDYDINFRKFIREGVMAQNRVEEHYRKQFGVLVGVLQEINADMEMLEKAENHNKLAYESDDVSKDKKDLLDKLASEKIEPFAMEAAMARNEAGIILGAVLYGGQDLDNQSESRKLAKEYLDARLKAKGSSLQEMQNMAREINGKLLPPTEIRMDVQAGMVKFADEFTAVKTLDAHTELSPQAKEFAIHNFDTAFKAVFTKEKQNELAERGQTMFDYIFIDGKSVSEQYEDKYKDCTFAEKQNYLKMEVMNKILAGGEYTIEAVLADQNGYAKKYPLNVTTNIPKLNNAVARTTSASKKLNANYEERVNVRLVHLSEAKNWKLSGTLTGVVNDETFETMKIYRNYSDGMTPEDKLKQGAMIIQAVTQKNVLDQNGAIDRNTLEALMSNVCVNGIPMRNLLQGEFNNETEKQAVDMIAGYIAKNMDEKSNSLETVSLLSNGKHVPLTFAPPKVPEITTKVSLFSSKEKKNAYEKEVLEHDNALKRQEIWNEKNRRAAEACQELSKLDMQPVKERMSFAEFAGEKSVRTRIQDMERSNSKKLENSKSKDAVKK